MIKRIITLLLLYAYSSITVADIFDFGQLSDENLVVSPLFLTENTEELEDELLNRQIRETQFEDLDFETKKWRSRRLESVLNKGRTFEDYDEKFSLVLGEVIASRGTSRIYRQEGNIVVKKGSQFKQGDLIETSSSGHVWIALIDGTLIRLSPDSTYSLESFEVSQLSLLMFHRINNGNINIIPRKEKGVGPQSTIETDRVFLPVFELFDFRKFLDYSSLTKNRIDNLHKEKYRYLNFLKKNNEGILEGKGVLHVVNTPFMIFEFDKADMEFVIDWAGSDFIKIRSKFKNFKSYKKNIIALKESEEFNTNTWYEINQKETKVSRNSSSAWFGDLVISDIPSIRILAEMFISENARKFFFSTSHKNFWAKYLISDKNLKDRKKFLLEYMNKQGASFLNERAVYIKNQKSNGISPLSSYLNKFYQYSNYFNRLFAELKLEVDAKNKVVGVAKMLELNNKLDAIFNEYETKLNDFKVQHHSRIRQP